LALTITRLQINKNESALTCVVKLVFFKLYISDLKPIAAFPEHWNLRVSKEIPQLVCIYKNSSKTSDSGNYALHIPHYNGNKSPNLPSYTRGNYWARLILKDNSRIIVYANSETEAKRVVNRLSDYVQNKYLTDNLAQGKLSKKLFEENKTNPVRADYYEKGKNQYLTWRKYF
jgi:hypothetical protein